MDSDRCILHSGTSSTAWNLWRGSITVFKQPISSLGQAISHNPLCSLPPCAGPSSQPASRECVIEVHGRVPDVGHHLTQLALWCVAMSATPEIHNHLNFSSHRCRGCRPHTNLPGVPSLLHIADPLLLLMKPITYQANNESKHSSVLHWRMSFDKVPHFCSLLPAVQTVEKQYLPCQCPWSTICKASKGLKTWFIGYGIQLYTWPFREISPIKHFVQIMSILQLTSVLSHSYSD